jgi:hypothetical protein
MKPAKCTCVGAVVETLAQTLTCPRRWWPRAGGGWEHTPRRTR